MNRTATTLGAIVRYSTFFHDKQIALVGTPVELADGTQYGLSMVPPAQFAIVARDGRVPTRPLELRGRVFDIGRFASDDSRLGPLNLPTVINALMPDRWPRREELFILSGATWTDANPQVAPSLRNLALQPEHFEGQTITIAGRFRGRNLLGDLPAWPRQSQWDFVLQTADAAVWVVGKRPKGDGFDLSTTSRSHTGRWLEVTGTVSIVDDLPLLKASRIVETEAEPEPEEVATPTAIPLPPPEVIFSAPVDAETDVSPSVMVQIQFSRPVTPATLQPNIRIRYADASLGAVPAWTVRYRPGPIAAEVEFESPLAGGVDVIVELTDGVQGVDGVGLLPRTIRFTTANRRSSSDPVVPVSLSAPAGRPAPAR